MYKATKRWLTDVIVSPALYGRALCPFAAGPFHRKPLSKLRISVTECSEEEELLQLVRDELDFLFPAGVPAGDVPETTLLVAPNHFQNDYRAMVHFSWNIMSHITSSAHLNQKVQVVNFHPQAVHSLMDIGGFEDGSSFSIRSPFPTFHFLREGDILKAVQSGYPNPEVAT